MRRLTQNIGALGLAAALIGGAAAWRSGAKFQIGRDSPQAQEITSETAVLPRRAPLNTAAPNPLNPVEAAQASQLWTQALEAYEQAEHKTEARRKVEPLLREIRRRWPDSAYAYESAVFAAETLIQGEPADLQLARRLEFVESALHYRKTYFSEAAQATTQSVSAEALKQLLAAGNGAEAWRLCLQLRWIAPRIDVLAPVCQDVRRRYPSLEQNADLVLAELSPAVPLQRLSSAAAGKVEAARIRRYVADPYSEIALEDAIRALFMGGEESLANDLLLELVEIDPNVIWSSENVGRKSFRP